jgi:serine/threonine protein kinase
MRQKRLILALMIFTHSLMGYAGIFSCIAALVFPKRYKTPLHRIENIPDEVIKKLDRKLHFLFNSTEKTFVSQSDSYIIPLDRFLGENRTPKGTPRFTIEELLGAGGQGAVFHAYDNLEQREVAIKISEIHENGPAAIALSKRLEKKLRDKNPLLTIFDYKLSNGWAFTISEWVPDRNYDHYRNIESPILTEEGALLFPYTPKSVIDHFTIMRNLTRALKEIHKNEFLYTDLKSENIAVFGDLQVKLLDLDSLAPLEEHGGVSVETLPLITPGLESPEMNKLWEARDKSKQTQEFLAKKVGVQSDAYSLSNVLQEMTNEFKNKNFKDDPLVNSSMHRLLKEVIYPLREKNPEKRMTIEEAEEKLNSLIASIQKSSKKSP